MAVNIIIAVLTGAILMMFIEYQHLEQDVSDRFYGIMKPFYHRLTMFAFFLNGYHGVLTYKDRNAAYIQDFINSIDEISKCAGHAIINGGDIPVMKSDAIHNLCESINNIWYIYDKGWFITEQIELDTDLFDNMKERIIEELKNYNPKYLCDINEKGLLPKVAGDFYVEEWQPVQDVTSEYEHFQKTCSLYHKLSFGILAYLLIALLCFLFVPKLDSSISANILAAISLLALGYDAYSLRKMMSMSSALYR